MGAGPCLRQRRRPGADLRRPETECGEQLDELDGGADTFHHRHAEARRQVGGEIGHSGATHDDPLGAILGDRPPDLLVLRLMMIDTP